MGLLDDAIREHLELKRRQGADPGEIARKEREALEPVLPNEPATWGAEPSPELEGALEGSGEPLPLAEEQHEAYAQAVELSAVGQETAEFDMSELLGGGEYAFPDAQPLAQEPAPVRAGRIIEPERQDELEWQVAGRAGSEQVQDIPGQERLSFE